MLSDLESDIKEVS